MPEDVRDEHVIVGKRAHAEFEGEVTERPTKTAKYGNLVLVNRGKSDDAPGASRKKVKRPRPAEGQDPKAKPGAPATEEPVASST